MGTKDVVEKVRNQNRYSENLVGHGNTMRMKEPRKTFSALVSLQLKYVTSCNTTYDYYIKGKNLPNM